MIAESHNSGMQVSCPYCQAVVTAPPAPPITPARQKISGLAIASLICALFLCVGCIPGIICGHLAKRRIRRDASLKGLGLANAGLVISYLFLILSAWTVVSWTYRVAKGTKQAFREVQQQIVSLPNSNVNAQLSVPADPQEERPLGEQPGTNATPAVSTINHQETTASAAAWTLDLSQASLPDQPASGNFRGTTFVGAAFKYRNGTLTITGPDGFSYAIHLGLKRGEPLGGRSFRVLPSDTAPACKLTITWKEDGNSTSQRIPKGYALKLQFGKASHNRIPAKIYLCLPDAQKSYLAGSFTVAGKS